MQDKSSWCLLLKSLDCNFLSYETLINPIKVRNKGIQARGQNRFETGCSTQKEIFDILDNQTKVKVMYCNSMPPWAAFALDAVMR